MAAKIPRRTLYLLGFIILSIEFVHLFNEKEWLRTDEVLIGKVNPVVSIRVVQISDLHITENKAFSQRVADQALAANPDLIVITGDAIDRTERLADLTEFLAFFRDKTVYAVFGNWEYWANLNITELRNIYSKSGVHLLQDLSAEYKKGNCKIEIFGVDDGPNPKSAKEIPFRNADPLKPVLILTHHPQTASNLAHAGKKEAGDNYLSLAGHTHGGQIAPFGWTPYLPPGSEIDGETGAFKAKSGVYRVNGTPLYVSRGVGTSIAPFRFGSPPTVSIINWAPPACN
jgi:predicted MPP superfamily phosphohydrolase